jgi:hypothetical protein
MRLALPAAWQFAELLPGVNERAAGSLKLRIQGQTVSAVALVSR